MDQTVREQILFVLEDDNELMRAALQPGSDLDARNKQLNRELIRKHEKILGGAFPNPEELAQQRDGLPAQPLYRVRFLQKHVWPDYRGPAGDVLELEIFQHWLE